MNRKQLVQLNPDFRILDNFAMSLLRRISVTYPHWIKYAAINEHEFDAKLSPLNKPWKQKYLKIMVPAPVHPTDRDLVIYVETENDSRITVGFDCYHTHFYQPRKSSELIPLTKKIGKKWKVVPGKRTYKVQYEDNAEEQQFEAARLFIEDIINEKRVVTIITKQDNQPGGCCNLYSDELDEIQPGSITYMRSWLGTYNRTWE